jgi:hypothetical protein
MPPTYYGVGPGDPLPWESWDKRNEGKTGITPEFREFVKNGFIALPNDDLPYPGDRTYYDWFPRAKCYSSQEPPHLRPPLPPEPRYWTAEEAVPYILASLDEGFMHQRYSEEVEVTVIDSIGGDAPPPWYHSILPWPPDHPVSAVRLRGHFAIGNGHIQLHPANTIYFAWDTTTGEALGIHYWIE